MKRESLVSVSIAVKPEAEEAVAELLESLSGVPACVYHDFRKGISTASVFMSDNSAWPLVSRAALAAGLERIRAAGLDIGRGTISVRRVKREDWAESWKRHFKPMTIGAALLIKPSWSKRRPRKGQEMVVLDPGLSFGTGQHPTTRFCLEQLVGCRKRGTRASFLDIGTGSGILAIAAVKLGYAPVEAFDVDPAAVRVAGANARSNGVRERLRLARRDLACWRPQQRQQRQRRRYDVVCANLTADLLLSEREQLLSGLKSGGRLVLAGILRSQFQDVARAYKGAGLKLERRVKEGEWVSGAFTDTSLE